MSNIKNSSQSEVTRSDISTSRAIVEYGNHNIEDTSSVITLRCVPMDLIPVNTNKMNIVWATQTYKYANCFDINKFPNQYYNHDDELINWISYAKEIQEELREIGKIAAQNEITRLFNSYLMPEMKNVPKTFDDVMSLIETKDWYYSRLDRNRHAIHKISYGIYHHYNNKWMKDVASEWLRVKKISLQNEDINGRKIVINDKAGTVSRSGKGFVYSNLIMRASNSIVDRIQTIMKFSYGEYITVRNKKKNNNAVYEKLDMQYHTAYLVKVPDIFLKDMSKDEKEDIDMQKTYIAWKKINICYKRARKFLDKVYQPTNDYKEYGK